MRDLILTGFILGMLPLILSRPAWGALMWVWVSMMNPHTLTFGFARSLPWALVVAIATLTGFLLTRHRKPLPLNGGTVFIVLLLLWMGVTSVFAINPDPGVVLDRWVLAVKILFMLIVTFMLLRGRQEIERLLWVMVIAVGFYGVKGGIWTLATGGGGRVWGPPGGTLSDNNSLAVGLIIILPWVYYLRDVAKRKWMRHGLLLAMIFIAFAVLGSQSRGAFLAVLGMTLVLGSKTKRFLRVTLILCAVGAAAVAFMPDSWTSRMDTIQTYQVDTSAMSRIWTWKTLWNVALDRPLVGAGFRADHLAVFTRYAPVDGFENFKGSVWVAHSIYLQALGEHGFVGLAIYLGLGLWTWLAASKLAKMTRDDPEFAGWVPQLMRMTQVSLAGFAIGGAFLSLMLLDLSYYIPGVVVLVHATVHARRRAAGAISKPNPHDSAQHIEGTRNHVLPGHSST